MLASSFCRFLIKFYYSGVKNEKFFRLSMPKTLDKRMNITIYFLFDKEKKLKVWCSSIGSDEASGYVTVNEVDKST